MTIDIALRIVQIQEQAMNDPEYLCLLEEFRIRSRELSALLDTLSGEKRDTIENYLGLTAQMHRFLLEFALQNSGAL